MPLSASSARARKIAARQNRLLREADKAEREIIARLAGILGVGQERVRAIFSSAGGAGAGEYLRLLELLAPVWNGLRSALSETLLSALGSQYRLGVAMVDEILSLAVAEPVLPAVRVDAFLDDVGRIRTRVLVGDVVEQAERKGRLAALRLTAGQEDLAATLKAIGSKLEGSQVFGRAAERLAGAGSSELGNAHSTGTQQRAEAADEQIDGLRKRWISSHRPTSRSSHLAVEARYADGIPITRKFRVGPYQTNGPRMPGLPGAERAHCQCRLVIVPAA